MNMIAPMTTFRPPTRIDREWMSRKEAARYLTSIGYPIEAQTLANMAAHNNAGRGPAFSKSRRVVCYNRADLEHWARGELVRVC